jgi:hypothetical protein
MTAGADKCPRNVFLAVRTAMQHAGKEASVRKDREMSANCNHIMIISKMKRDDDELPRGTSAASGLQAAYLRATMSSRRDDLFPSGSIGRSQGIFIQRTPSPAPSLTRETLTAHPLFSPSPSSAPVTSSTAPTSDIQDASAPGAPGTRYATYTPRHRTAPTTGTTLQSSLPVSPQQQPGGSPAATKLQLMNLKAYAQSIGLETNSLGWEILEKLVAEHDNNPEWADIWTALTIGKVLVVSHCQKQSSSTFGYFRLRSSYLLRMEDPSISRPTL